MIGLVFVMHGVLGETLKGELEHVVGPQAQAAVFNVTATTLPGTCGLALRQAIDSVDSGQGVILLTDMFGSTPSNIAVSVLENDRVEVLAGVNMPMLVKLAQMRGHAGMRECLSGAEEAGRRYISVASHLPPACLTGAGECAVAAVDSVAGHGG
ncbi:PTS fructose transporter subunit IIA [Komagataeibacter rhaeticus]|uniref:PTS fructose transporter subunit IIA n=1 Tax=Komagataeibacter rhaeticus TaxID=215221 RepID=A0A181CEJ8_9PROT|nr:PTS fructose transporter subunit IIA [Komagataeibacter rhaeticus]ATU74024.1 PTS fructose transporter subunit IIA [Komagataeibacter xylinus]EGG77889.1 Fructose-specific phosphotransferase enzyme IIA component [Gluconacetobacter sp. SXCC-1]KDU97573.1 PTS fructose transporter subunit IIA [Komagataeibacter rhaeticus AF1]MBL7240847.1 PTS fructose transporter subunit IIA [Komagataeibacter rhaeticus]PYD54896.1 PTS fructose transporter subunit IIA [Komagataeibacter rhaeticus]